MAANEVIVVTVRDNGSAEVVRKNIERVGGQADRSVSSVDGLNRVLGLLGTALSVGQVVKWIDSFTSLEGRLKALARPGQDAKKLFEDLFKLAQSTRSPFEQTVNTYLRLDTTLRGMGKTSSQTMRMVETINKGLIIGGLSASEMGSVLTQLAQGIGSGKFAGDELKSFTENATFMANEVAKAIIGPNGTTTMLRKMGEEGKLTAEVMFTAFDKIAKSVDEKMGKVPLTISQAFTLLSQSFQKFIYDSQQAAGGAALIADGLQWLANNIPTVASVLITLVATYGTYKIAAMAGAAATALFTGALMINPIVLFLAAAAGIITWLLTYGQNIEIAGVKTTNLAAVTREALGVVWDMIKKVVLGVWDFVKAVAEGFLSAAKSVIGFVDGTISTFQNMWNSVKNGFQSAWAAVQVYWEDFKRYVLGSWVGSIISAINSVIQAAQRAVEAVKAVYTSTGQGGGGAAPAQPAGAAATQAKFATGGSFQVTGSGGTDSQNVAFRATPGEQVTITPPGGLSPIIVNSGVGELAPSIRGLQTIQQDQVGVLENMDKTLDGIESSIDSGLNAVHMGVLAVRDAVMGLQGSLAQSRASSPSPVTGGTSTGGSTSAGGASGSVADYLASQGFVPAFQNNIGGVHTAPGMTNNRDDNHYAAVGGITWDVSGGREADFIRAMNGWNTSNNPSARALAAGAPQQTYNIYGPAGVTQSTSDPNRYPDGRRIFPMLQHGGEFTVSGKSGTDTNLVQFMATKGERVLVETPDQARSGGGDQRPIQVFIEVDARGNANAERDFRKSARQISQDLGRAIASAL